MPEPGTSSLAPSPIYVVSGLPRSGTSLAMQMLVAGGLPAFTDGVRAPDDDNPRGYFEHELTKRLADPETSTGWLDDAQGRVIKVISFLLLRLPPGRSYRVLFLERELSEVLASQSQMLVRRQEPEIVAPALAAAAWRSHLRDLELVLRDRPDISMLKVSHRTLLSAPGPEIQRICAFLGLPLDAERMRAAIDPSLFRNRDGRMPGSAGAPVDAVKP